MEDTILKPLRRVVTGNDEQGRSRVVWDGPAPSAHELAVGATRGHTDLWIWNETPPRLDDREDPANGHYNFPGPRAGGHLRAVQSRARPANYDPANDPSIMAPHEPVEVPTGRRWDRGGRSAFAGDMHKTETVDYAILIEGERVLGLDDGEVLWKPGDVVIDVAAWHSWTSPREPGIVMFDMIAAKFIDGQAGLAQGNDRVMVAEPSRVLPDGVKPTRRIVIADREPGKSSVISDGPSPDVRFDAARPGFASTRLWMVDGAPARIVLETLHLPHAMLPPASGSLLRVVTIPPDDSWQGKVGAAQVQAFFRDMGAQGASTYSAQAPHPYMQKTRTLDFCLVIEGEVVLMLDTQEVTLHKGDIIIQRGTNHAWSNRTTRPAVVAIASHDAA
jgi:mannose-6-phosphate isomerase-like protein (cupin superfamily)